MYNIEIDYKLLDSDEISNEELLLQVKDRTKYIHNFANTWHFVRAMQCHYNFEQCGKYILDQEKLQNISYDFIVYVRPDVYFTADCAPIYKYDISKVVVGSVIANTICSDFIAIIPRKQMDSFFFDRMKLYRTNTSRSFQIAEDIYLSTLDFSYATIGKYYINRNTHGFDWSATLIPHIEPTQVEIKNVALVIPIHPPNYHYMYKLLDKIGSKIDVYLVFSSSTDYDKFEKKTQIIPICIPPHITTGSIPVFKKFYGLKYLKDVDKYDYFIACDSESDIIIENFTATNLSKKIEQIYNNKIIYGGAISNDYMNTITATTANVFIDKTHVAKIKQTTQNFSLFYWWSDLPVYKRAHINDLFDKIYLDNITWGCFEHKIYLNYLILYHGFTILNITPLIQCIKSLESYYTKDEAKLNILKANGYGFSWIGPELYNRHKDYLLAAGAIFIYHLDRHITVSTRPALTQSYFSRFFPQIR